MKKLFLFLLLSLSYIGSANAEWHYTCEVSEKSFYYNHSKQEIPVFIDLAPDHPLCIEAEKNND